MGWDKVHFVSFRDAVWPQERPRHGSAGCLRTMSGGAPHTAQGLTVQELSPSGVG